MGQWRRFALFTIRRLGLWSILVLGVLGAEAAIPKPPYPVIFVHGIYADASLWDTMGTYLLEQGWTYGGDFAPNQNGTVSTGTKSPLPNDRVQPKADFYVLSFSSGEHLRFDQQGFELKLVIHEVLRRTGKERVILVAHSMGGLAGRAYLEYWEEPTSPRVHHLITFGTPHLGSEVARRCRESPVWSPICTIFKDVDSTAVIALSPDSSELTSLNDTAPDRPATRLPATTLYTSIVVRGWNDLWGDGVVSANSQNLGNVPSFSQALWDRRHRAVEVRMAGICFNPFAVQLAPHSCESNDVNVRREILAAIATEDVSLELALSRNPIALDESFTISLQPRPPRETALKRLYLALLHPTGSISFQQRLGQEFSWVPDMRPAREFTPLTNRNVLESARFRETAPRGVYRYYALFTAEGTEPTDRLNWRSNVAMVQLYVGVQPPPPPRGKFVYVSSHQLTPTRFEPPSELWRVEIHPEGEDRLIGTIRTATGERPLITDLALTPAGDLYGISATHLYRIEPTTALATPIGPFGVTAAMVAIASDATGQLYAANSAAGVLTSPQLFRIDRASGKATSIVSFSIAASAGASGDMAIDPTGKVYFVREPDLLFCFWDCNDSLTAFDLNDALTSPWHSVILNSIGSLGRTGVFGLAFVDGELYGFTTERNRTTGSLIRLRVWGPRRAVEVIPVRALSFQASGAALRVER